MPHAHRFIALGLICLPLAACGGGGEIGPATKAPVVDQKKMHDEMQKSFQMGKPAGTAPGSEAAKTP